MVVMLRGEVLVHSLRGQAIAIEFAYNNSKTRLGNDFNKVIDVHNESC